jgi:carbon storage regulator
MLVLTRKRNESIIVGDVTITVVRTARGEVRLGITAPKNVLILREELARRLADGEPRYAVAE